MKETAIETVTIREADLGRCRFCDSTNITRKGTKKLKKGTFQNFQCSDCKRFFIHNLGFERKRATPEQITMAVDLLFSGLSSRKAAKFIRMTGADVSHVTVQNWAREYTGLMDRFMDSITPQVGEQWRTDEVYLKIRGKRRYLFTTLDSKTRYWLASMVAEHKGNDDVEPMFKKAKELAGKVPSRLVSDGAANFAHAHKKQFASKSAMDKESTHERHIHMDGDMNNNQIESFNGNTVRLREKVTRGLKREDSAILAGLRLYYNIVHDHQGLPGNTTPGEAAGIHVEGLNKWKTMIQAAAKFAICPTFFVGPPMLQPIPAHEYVTIPLPPVTVIPAMSVGALPQQAFTSTINLPPTATIQTRLWTQVDSGHEHLRL